MKKKYNPLVLLRSDRLTVLIKAGFYYFVRQTYERGRGDDSQTALLMTPYKTQEDANEHYINIKDDKNKFIYSVDPKARDQHSVKDHLARLFKASEQQPGFPVYVDQMAHQGTEWFPPQWLIAKMHQFVKYLGWGHSNNHITSNLAVKHGQLFVVFTLKNMKEIISLDDIEKY